MGESEGQGSEVKQKLAAAFRLEFVTSPELKEQSGRTNAWSSGDDAVGSLLGDGAGAVWSS